MPEPLTNVTVHLPDDLLRHVDDWAERSADSARSAVVRGIVGEDLRRRRDADHERLAERDGNAGARLVHWLGGARE